MQKSLVQLRLRAYIDKKTILLNPSEPYLHEYKVSFKCSSDDGCMVEVYFFCSEDSKSTRPNFQSQRPFSGSETFCIQPGENQECTVAWPDFFRASLPDLTFAQRQVYPLAIVVAPFEAEGVEYQAQVTYMKFQVTRTEMKLLPIRQRVINGKKSMETMDMYGIRKEESEEDDCIICMSEPKNTAVLPCNHFCICHGCARLLLNTGKPECPICRAPPTSYVKINISQ